MKSRLKSALAVLIAAVVVFSTVMSATASVSVQYSPSDSYKNSKYYEAYKNVKLTGDNVTDIINIALSQVGYHESNSSCDLSGDSNGAGSCTEYGRWYGNQTDWCNIFVSWCAYVAGISEDVFPKLPSCSQSYYSVLPSVKAKCFEFDGGESVKPGDLFFSCTCCGSHGCIDHVGLIVDVDEDYIYTVEGNLTDQVQYVAYPASTGYSEKKNAQINYIARPNYKTVKLTASDVENATAIKVTKTDIIALYDYSLDTKEIEKFASSVGGKLADVKKYNKEILSLLEKSAYGRCVVTEDNKNAVINKDGDISKYSENIRSAFCITIPLETIKPVNTANFGGNKYEIYDTDISFDLMNAFVKSAAGSFISKINDTEKVLLPLLFKESSEYFINENGSIKNDNAKKNANKKGYVVKYSEAEKVIITFDGNGGENTPIEQMATKGEKITLKTSVPQNDNMKFSGWAYSENAEKPDFSINDTAIFNKNTTLFAVWEK